MTLDRYDYIASETMLDFEFESKGPKGKIRKIIRFGLQHSNGITFCNLGFGDINAKTGTIEDLAISNNNDKDKILATVAAVVLAFTDNFPDMMVYAEGSTPARTRLYQMALGKHWNEVEPVLDVYGLTGNRWQKFRKNINYKAFVVARKK